MNLKIGWLYPDSMSTYGDRGNVIALLYRARSRGIGATVITISVADSVDKINRADLFFMGGAQDLQQEIVAKDLRAEKGIFLKKAIERGIPGLYICGAFQFLGKYYKTSEGKILEGLDIFDLYTQSGQEKEKRLVGDMVFNPFFAPDKRFVGFENHNGRTYLGKGTQPFGKILKGFGNNGKDGTEGMVYKNSIGSYSHGPLLPKNPELTDWLVQKALQLKYKRKIKLKNLDTKYEDLARKTVIKKLID